jgi:iron complex transport system ATP-binding protein
MAEVPIAVENVYWTHKSGGFEFGPVSAVAERGHFIALVGPNGAGKSTLLNLLSGLLVPPVGVVKFSGRDCKHWSPRERGRQIAFLSQEPEKPFGFSVEDYVALGRFPHLGPFRSPGRSDRQLVEQEMEQWGLTPLQYRSVSTLSGGEFQRARLARALVQNPAVLLLDEPGNHLDIAGRMEILNRLQKEAGGGRTVIAVLHDINDALLYADQVWLLAGGELRFTGSPAEVLTPEKLKSVYGITLTTFNNGDGLTMLGVPPFSRSLPD